jgi:hypothetical protein
VTPRPAHQPIDGLAESLGRRAEVEGRASGLRRATRRQLLRWAAIWGAALLAATLLGAAAGWLPWLPLAALTLAALSLGLLMAGRARAARDLAEARDTLDGTLSELARDPRKDHQR